MSFKKRYRDLEMEVYSALRTIIEQSDVESKITDDKDIMDIASNIARAIKNECVSGMGITTDDIDTYTESVEITPQYLDESVTVKMF